MVVDPTFYQKHSGRSGDPYERMGQALASDSARSSARKREKEKSVGDHMIDGHFKAMKMKWIISIVASLAVLIAIMLGLM